MNFLRKNKESQAGNKYQVLFICTGNICRSPMAEGILKKLIPEEYKGKIKVFSAGTGGFFNIPASYLAMEVARENDVNIQHHLSQGVTDFLLQKSNLVLALARDHENYLINHFPNYRNKVFLLKVFASENKPEFCSDIDDPIGRNKEFYAIIYQEIEFELKRILPEILQLADNYLQ